MDSRGFPTSLPEFQAVFPTDEACAGYLEKLRWPEGFTCPKCASKAEPYRFTAFPDRFRCRACKVNTYLTAGTVMQGTRTPLKTWFWAAFLVTVETPGKSALQFQKLLGITRYETAFQLFHKLRAGMVRPERDSIGGEHDVEADECFVGGRTRGEGHGKHHKAVVVGAVEVRMRKDAEERKAKWAESHDKGIPLKKLVYAGRLRLRVVPDKGSEHLTGFVKENVLVGSLVRTDGSASYDLPEYRHAPLAINGDPEKADAHLPMIHLVFSNLKTWLLGTHHGVSQQHLQAYLNEFTFRFNRRFYPMTAFHSVLGISAHTVPPTYEGLYSGEWEHPS
jgi:transposase-like protein